MSNTSFKKPIVILTSTLNKCVKLRKELQNESFTVLILSEVKKIDIDTFTNINNIKLRKIVKRNQSGYISEYLKVMDEISSWNTKNTCWWATMLATKHRYLSPLSNRLPKVLQAIEALESSTNLVIVSNDLFVTRCIKNIALNKGYDIKTHKINYCLFKTRYIILFWAEYFKHLIYNLLKVIKYSILFNNKSKLLTSDYTYLIKSFYYPNNNANANIDPIFNDLGKYIGSTSEDNILTLLDIVGSYTTKDKQKIYSTENVHIVDKYLLPSDYISAVYTSIKEFIYSPFSVRDKVFFLGMILHR